MDDSATPTCGTSTNGASGGRRPYDIDGVAAEPADGERKGRSLPAPLQRVMPRLSEARANGSLGPAFDDLIDRVARELDVARGGSRGLRGDARLALLERLVTLDAELVRTARESLAPDARAALAADAEAELAAFRASMSSDAFARARDLAIDRFVRERYRLPIVAFS